jgi:drug/metabolite transporter (DMT)-like permease
MDVRLLLGFSVLLASAGQVFFKKGMNALGAQSIPSSLMGILEMLIRIVFSPMVFAGLVLYISSTLVWLLALSRTSLNFAYPFTALTFILVMLSSSLILSETLPVNRIIGAAIICFGVILSSIK